jgi:hypothetical protein
VAQKGLLVPMLMMISRMVKLTDIMVYLSHMKFLYMPDACTRLFLVGSNVTLSLLQVSVFRILAYFLKFLINIFYN